ncbi:MAG: sigma-70 family RNA polymerase sigma factor [Trueperaceae bacterium]|nr:sigma-70 family RNA polymerase sigma factor [Trueperaceae bacterium]
MDTEEQLILGLQSGDEASLARLYELLSNQVYALALQMLRNREDAQEVLQDTFVKLYQNAERFKPEFGSARAYIYTIARNECRMRLRAKQSRPQKLADIDLHDPASSFGDGHETDHDVRITVAKALEHLETEDQHLLKASFYEGYSHAELADQTGMPLGTVKSKVRRALLKLRDFLGDV